jgi:hypothetical protein
MTREELQNRYIPQVLTMTREDLQQRFVHHPPTDDQFDRLRQVRQLLLATSVTIITDLCPQESAERTLAIRKLEEAMFWANAAIAREKT